MKLSNVLIIIILFTFSYGSLKAQEDVFVKKALELLKDYKVQTPKVEKPIKSVEQLWKEETNKYFENTKGAIRYCTNIIAFSSQYSGDGWSANQVIGIPNVYPGYGDNANAWTSSSPDGQREFLELGFDNPMPISNIAVYETFNSGAVDTIYIKNPNTGNWEIVYQGASQHIQTSRIFEVSFPLTSFPVSQVRLAIDAVGVPGWNEIDAVAIADEQINPFIVNIMPSYGQSQQYANAIINQNISVWGNIKGGMPPYNYTIDFGDGTNVSGSVTDMHFVGEEHQYTTAGVKTAKLTITDNNGITKSREALIRVFAAPTQQVKVNIAIEKGLLFLYKSQTPDGFWYGEDYVAVTGMATLAFEEN
nr:PKD domain-containing protein [Melioribacteraceae bacterium]